jgi:endonuclease VIII
MPEGDTIFRAARTLHRALAGKTVVRFESMLPALTRVHDDHPIPGRTVERVAARGKHILVSFSGDLILHTHMRMNGSWHIYRPGERWQRSAREMRVLVASADMVAVGFNIPIAEFLDARGLERREQLRQLGPDLLSDRFDRAEALRRVRAHPDDAIGDVLLNQRVMAGIGNVLKSETLFVAGVDPFARVRDLTNDALERLFGVGRRLLSINARPHAGAFRQTTGRMNPSESLWVYGRGGLPCRTCGEPIRARKTGLDARLTYWCPRCQKSG